MLDTTENLRYHGFDIINQGGTMLRFFIFVFIFVFIFEIAHGASYNDLIQKTYARPLNRPPLRKGISSAEVAKALFAHKGRIVGDSVRSLEQNIDYHEPREKLLHPAGVCASVTWTIDRVTPATGLFSFGTRVNGIIRFSSGTSESRIDQNPAGRIFGLALKLFPTQNNDENVETQNIQMLDNYGFDRATRLRFFHPDQNEDVFFTNIAPAKGLFGQALATFFDRFDRPNYSRPVYPLSEIDQYGKKVTFPLSPREIWFVQSFPKNNLYFKDFREELLSYDNNEVILDIYVRTFEKFYLPEVAAQPIGRIVVSKMVVSDFCDLNLNFHHPKNR